MAETKIIGIETKVLILETDLNGRDYKNLINLNNIKI